MSSGHADLSPRPRTSAERRQTHWVDDDERQRRMCTGKERHKDQAAAEQAMRRAEWSGDRGSAPVLRTYRCYYCDRWHLTSQSPR